MEKEKKVLADLSVEEAQAFQRTFSRKAALKDAMKQITEALAEEQAKEDELWNRARQRYNINESAIHINCGERKIYSGFSE